MKKSMALGLMAVVVLVLPPLGMSWGYVGHRISGLVAEHFLNEKAALAIEDLLDGEKLSMVMSWADDMRDDAYWQEQNAGSWHYLNVEDDAIYSPSTEKPDVYTQILFYEARLRDQSITKSERAIALKWFVHLVTDIHQPLHVGRGSDKGGNDIEVTFLGEETNLHSVWDTKLLMNRKVSETAYASFLVDTISRRKQKRWAQASYRDWITEGRHIRAQVYNFEGTDLDERYYRKNIKLVDERLAMGGYRLAHRLNAIFGE